MADEPSVPLLKKELTAAEELTLVSKAMAQAAQDAAHLPPGFHFAYRKTETAQGLAFTIRAENAYGIVAWEQTYYGHSFAVGGGLTW